jgi:hypothetical protein
MFDILQLQRYQCYSIDTIYVDSEGVSHSISLNHSVSMHEQGLAVDFSKGDANVYVVVENVHFQVGVDSDVHSVERAITYFLD